MDQVLKIWNLAILLMCCFRNTSVYCLESSELFNQDTFKSSNCTVSLKTVRSKLLLEKYISDVKTRLIRLNITVVWKNLTKGNDSYPSNMEWYMTTSQSGKRLLLLGKNFELMSLGTLSHGVDTMSIHFEQSPLDCLSAYTPEKAYDVIYYSLLTIPNSNETTNDDENEDYNVLEVCDGYSEKPVCCRLTLLGNLKCDEHVTDKWVSVLENVLFIIIFLLVSFSLKFVPRSWYDTDNSVFEFMEPIERRQDDNRSHQIMFNSINAKRRNSNPSQNDVKIFKKTSKSKCLQDLFKKITEVNKMYRIRVSFNKIFAETDQLVSEVTQSSGLKYFFSRLMLFLSYICFTCRIRNINLVLKWLCYKESCCKLYLYQCLGKIIKIFLSLLCSAPLLLRGIYVRYYDNDQFSSWVSSVVMLYIFVIYMIIINVFWPNNLRKLKDLLRECLHLTLIQCWAERLWSIKKIVLPKRFESYPVIRCVYALLLFVPCIIYLCLSFFPYIHFLLIQIVNFQQRMGRDSICTSAYVCFCGILLNVNIFISLYVIIDTIWFFVLCFSYTFIGFVVNSSTILPYATVILLMCTYIYDCFQDTHKKVDKFKNAVIKILKENNETLVKEIYNLSMQFRKSLFLFTSNIETENSPRKPVILLDGSVCWLATRVPLFYKINKTDKLPYLHIPELFLHRVMEYPSRITPGSIYKMYCKNVRDILIMLVVLVAAIYGITSFGNVHKISSGVQSLVTVGGALLLFIFNKILARTRVFEVDDKGSHLKEIIKRVSESYSELWKIEGYTEISVTRTDSEDEADLVKDERYWGETFYVNKSICQIYSEDTNSEETEGCCKNCCGCVIINIPDEHNGYESFGPDELQPICN